METFGARLKTEREGRGLTIRTVAEALGVADDSLLALERNDFEALPAEPVMMRCLKGYAKCLEVDAELMIADYLREREGHLAAPADSVPEPAADAAPLAVVTAEVRPQRFPRTVSAATIVVLVVIAGAWWMLSGDESPARPERPVATTPIRSEPVESEPVEARPRTESPRPVESTLVPTSLAPAMRIGESGVGTAVENRRLVGERERFAAGTQVWFWTSVEGGAPGDRIDHVWLDGGQEVARIPLKIGGSPWRTYSAKTLRGGSSSRWAVEARDPQGRVLARSEFTCVP